MTDVRATGQWQLDRRAEDKPVRELGTATGLHMNISSCLRRASQQHTTSQAGRETVRRGRQADRQTDTGSSAGPTSDAARKDKRTIAQTTETGKEAGRAAEGMPLGSAAQLVWV